MTAGKIRSDQLRSDEGLVAQLRLHGMWASSPAHVEKIAALHSPLVGTLSLWWALVFMVPVFNFLMIATLVCLPSRDKDTELAQTETYTFRTATIGIAVTALLLFVGVALLAQGVESYGYALFFSTPFLLGAVIGFLLRAPKDYGFLVTVGVVSVTLLLGCLALIFFALEGIICIMMSSGEVQKAPGRAFRFTS